MLKGKNKNLIGLVAAIVCVFNGVMLCQAMKKPSLNEKMQVNQVNKGNESVDEKLTEIDGVLIPQSNKLINYSKVLEISENAKNSYEYEHGGVKSFYDFDISYINGFILKFSWDKSKSLDKFCGFNDFSLNQISDQEKKGQIFISKSAIQKVSQNLFEKWFKNIVQYYDNELFDKLAQRVVAFFDVTKVVHYFVCFSNNEKLAFLGSSSYGVCDDENSAAGYKEQNDISFVNELDEKSFKENCWLGSIIRCDHCGIMNDLSFLDYVKPADIFNKKRNVNEKIEVKPKQSNNISIPKDAQSIDYLEFKAKSPVKATKMKNFYNDINKETIIWKWKNSELPNGDKCTGISCKDDQCVKITFEDIKDKGLLLLKQWLLKNFHFVNESQLKNQLQSLLDKVVVFFDFRKITHYFVCLGENNSLVFLGSFNHNVFDDETQKQDSVSYSLDLNKFKDNCYLEVFIRCIDGGVMDDLKILKED